MAKWSIDPDHSVAAFTVRHLTVAEVHGQFNTISGTVNFDPADQAGFSLGGGYRYHRHLYRHRQTR